MSIQLTLLAEGFPASPSVQPGSDEAQKILGISGRRCLTSLEQLNPNTSWAKTFTALLIGTKGWFSTRCVLTWKLKGMKSRRFYFQLRPLTHHTEEIEFGLWPTPCARDTQGPQAQELKALRGEPQVFQMESVPGRIRKLTGVIGQNNPMFYLEMMGYPQDWTLKPFQKLEGKPSKPWETP
jgi:hypothetical protein